MHLYTLYEYNYGGKWKLQSTDYKVHKYCLNINSQWSDIQKSQCEEFVKVLFAWNTSKYITIKYIPF